MKTKTSLVVILHSTQQAIKAIAWLLLIFINVIVNNARLFACLDIFIQFKMKNEAPFEVYLYICCYLFVLSLILWVKGTKGGDNGQLI